MPPPSRYRRRRVPLFIKGWMYVPDRVNSRDCLRFNLHVMANLLTPITVRNVFGATVTSTPIFPRDFVDTL